MSILAADLRNLIIASLSKAEPTAREKLELNVPRYWSLYARVAYPELRFWYVRREAIRLCMACNTQQIDYLRRTQDSARTSIESSNQDSTMSASAEDNYTAQADRSSESTFDSETNSSSSGAQSRTRSSTQSASSAMSYSDTGQGENSASRSSSQSASGSGTASQSETDSSFMNDGRTRNVSRAFSNTMTQFGAGGGIIIGSVGITTTERTGTDNSSLTDNATGHQESSLTGSQSQSRSAGANESGVQISSSEFTANVASSESGVETMSLTGGGSGSSSFTLTGAGAGNMNSTGTSESNMTGTSSRTASGEGVSQRNSQAQSQMNSLMERLHQRFLHLQDLWKQADETIKLFESQRLALTPYIISQITIQYPDGIDAVTANAFLVKQPYAAR